MKGIFSSFRGARPKTNPDQHPDLTVFHASVEAGDQDELIHTIDLGTVSSVVTSPVAETTEQHPDLYVFEACASLLSAATPPELELDVFDLNEPTAEFPDNSDEQLPKAVDHFLASDERIAIEKDDEPIFDLSAEREEFPFDTHIESFDVVDLNDQHVFDDLDNLNAFESITESFLGSEGFDDPVDETFDIEFLDDEDFDSAQTSEPTIQDWRLDQYASRLVMQLDAIRLKDRERLHRRFRVVLNEFPFATSLAAILRLLEDGATLEDIEDICSLKCSWRASTWLWARRRHVAFLSGWEIESHSALRHALTWKTARHLVERFGSVEALAALSEDWFQAWQGLELRTVIGHAEEVAFYSYAGFLSILTKTDCFEDPDIWFYEEAADRPNVARLEVLGEGGHPIWRFEHKGAMQGGETSLQPYRIRKYLQLDSEALDIQNALGGVFATSPAEVSGNGFLRRYGFPQQECSLRPNEGVSVESKERKGLAIITAFDTTIRSITLHVEVQYADLLTDRLTILRISKAVPRDTNNVVKIRAPKVKTKQRGHVTGSTLNAKANLKKWPSSTPDVLYDENLESDLRAALRQEKDK